jgi:hypothetical protein
MENTTIELTDKYEAIDSAHKQIDLLENDADKFLVAIWAIKDGRIFLAGRTTWEFPDADLPIAIRQLRMAFNQDVPTAPAPLPAAKIEDL